MQFPIPQKVLMIYTKLKEAGFVVYFVGGCVRNILLNKPIKDWDMTTSATPEEMLKLFPDGFYDNAFGTVGIPVITASEVSNNNQAEVVRGESAENNFFAGRKSELRTQEKIHSQASSEQRKVIVEVTTFRTERDYTDNRHPESVTWGTSIEEDLERRDFTVNAIAMEITDTTKSEQTLETIKLIDPFHGQEDLQNHILRAVGIPTKRFKEDALRLMRAIRFATQLSFTIENATWEAMLSDAPLLANIAPERIQDELLKILVSDFPYEGIMLLKNANLLEYILPELLEGIKLSQVRPGRHHTEDVFTHNVLSLKFCPSTDPIVRFATLIHDVGKSRVVGKDENGFVIFYNHEIAGAQMAYEICNRLHFSKKDREKITKLIRWHMFTVDEHITDAAIRRFIRRIGVASVKDMIDLRIGDRLGSGIPQSRAESWRLKLFKERLERELAPAAFSINDLAIDGNDIMQTLKIQPGPQIGKLLQKLFEEVDEDKSKNTKEYLVKRAKEINV